MAIYYLVPDNENPSWGVGVIYHHVKALLELGIDACLLHEREGFKLSWLQMELPVRYQSNLTSAQLNENDTIIVPEVMANSEYLKKCKAHKILFIQASAYIFENIPAKKSHIDLGFEKVIVIMNHMIPIVEKFIKLPHILIPPMIADYFLDNKISVTRKKEIIIYPKFDQIDFSIVRNLILRKIGQNRIKKALGFDWRLILLENLTHKKVAQAFQNSHFFISLNLFEALNTSVVEAMASGCIVFCYEGFGPRDYLENGKNAFVFANNEPYQLIDKLYEILDNFEQMQLELNEMQNYAKKTAEKFSYNHMKTALIFNMNRIM